ncbi:unnamed protein product [Blepharisma stoltei]|uniref:Hsp33 family molecular chaperone HslO n=1 Tax=Blepharisma stoltei TaxID=1481888 RepID=A0AAU9KD19_9CILI|nr:unnamed protein product [Blepharisma stoltei]
MIKFIKRNFQPFTKNPTDLLVHLFSPKFRASFTQAKKITQEVKERNEIEDLNLIREIHCAYSSSILLASFLNSGERIKVYSGHDSVTFGQAFNVDVLAESWGDHFIRGFARKTEVDSTNEQGNFCVERRIFGSGEPFVSARELGDFNKGLFDEDVQQYCDSSEQIPSKVYISGKNFEDKSGNYSTLGLLIQILPGTEKEYIDEIYEKISQKSFFKEIHNTDIDEKSIKKLFEDVNDDITYSTKEFTFKCDCTKELVQKFLESMDKDSLIKLKQDPYQLINCSFCNNPYEFSRDEIDSFIADDLIDLSVRRK